MSFTDLPYPLLAALCYSTNPILIKFGLHLSNEPLLGACIGMAASSAAFIVYFFSTEQRKTLRALPMRVLWYLTGAGLCSTLGVFTFFAAHQYILASVVAPLTAAAPLVTVALSHAALKGEEQVSRADVCGTLLIVIGVVLLVS